MATKFETYDWENDPEWKKRESNIFISPEQEYRRESIILKKKAQYYKLKIDPDFEIPDTSSSSSRARSSSSEDASSDSSDSSDSYSSYSSSSSSSSATDEDSSGARNYSYESSSSYSAPPSPFSRTVGIALSYFQLFSHIFLLLLFILYIIPLLGTAFSYQCFYHILLLSIALNILHLLRTHGRPQWNTLYGRRILFDEHSHFILYSAALYAALPSLVFMIPILVRSAIFISRAFSSILPSRYPSLWRLVEKPVTKVVTNGNELWRFNSMTEVGVGITQLILLLIQSPRNFLAPIFYWQYLRLRYMLSSDCKMAFRNVRISLDRLFVGPTSYVPRPIGAIYTRIINFISSLGEPPQQQQAAPRCTIM